MEPTFDGDDDDLEEAAGDPPEDLKPSEKKALIDLREMLEEVILSGDLIKPPPPRHHHEGRHRTRVATEGKEEEQSKEEKGEEEVLDPGGVSLWGIPLLPSKKHEGTDVILLKFLRAQEFKAAEALEMLRRTLRWRREFGLDCAKGVCENDEEAAALAEHLRGAAYIAGRDRDGNPVCYNVYGVFKDREVYRRAVGSAERRQRLLRWRVRLMEQGIEQMSLHSGGSATLLHIIDFKDMLRPGLKELRTATREVVAVLQDNYPEFVAKNIFLNVSFRYYAYHALFSPFITPRTRSKFIFARSSKVTETLLKFISAENIPVQYGGLRRENDEEFSEDNGIASEITLKGGTSSIEIPIVEPGVTVVWDVTVVGWEVDYKEEFIPDDEGSYKILIQKERNLEECVRNSFYISEPGKLVLTITNKTYKKKRVLYRSKSKPTIPLYTLPDPLHPTVQSPSGSRRT
ncbi:patellin-4-like [Zingiber officinale]|uniref:patellin-4-like n=1 Tax=Zingiber officinale TaxID=94328 RepID=UPI001C4DC929|nr:patellin-4-like [Zingiber officinale]